MADFKIGLELILRREGGYANDPADRGGETFMGITRKNHPDSQMWSIVDDYKKRKLSYTELTNKLKNNEIVLNCVYDIYKKKYWNVLDLDTINSQPIANLLFDIAVNMGVSKAKTVMKNIMNHKGDPDSITEEFVKYANT